MSKPEKDTRPAPIPEHPLVSVIITTKNRSKFLREAIKSVLGIERQGFDLEVIVVDDGSTDDTPEVLKEFPVKVLRTSGIGMARARNTGLHEARGDFVTLLDDDDMWMPANIRPHIELFRQHPEYGSVHAQAQLMTYDGEPFWIPVPPGPLQSGMIFEKLLTYFPQVGTILTRAEAAREAGDLDPSLTGDTDWDWLLRIAKRHPIGTIEQPVLLFRQRNTAEEALSWRRFPAMVRIFKRHTHPLGLLTQIRLRPILWRHRGTWAYQFIMYAQINHANGLTQRALRSVYYAFRCSPPHALLNLVRHWPFKKAGDASEAGQVKPAS